MQNRTFDAYFAAINRIYIPLAISGLELIGFTFHLILFGMQNRRFDAYFAAINRIYFPLTLSGFHLSFGIYISD
jgi:hypothetical protein